MNKYFPISLAMMLAAAALLTGAVEASNTNLKTTVTKSVGTKNGKNTPAPLVLDTKKGNVTIDVTKKGPKLDPKVTTTPLDLGKKGPKLDPKVTTTVHDLKKIDVVPHHVSTKPYYKPYCGKWGGWWCGGGYGWCHWGWCHHWCHPCPPPCFGWFGCPVIVEQIVVVPPVDVLPPGGQPGPGGNGNPDPVPEDAKLQTVRFLKLRNDTGVKLTVFVQYLTVAGDKVEWLPGEPGTDKAISFTMEDGQELTVEDNGPKLAAGVIRLWAVSETVQLTDFRDKDLVIVPEKDKNGNPGYAAPAPTTMTITFPRPQQTSQAPMPANTDVAVLRFGAVAGM